MVAINDSIFGADETPQTLVEWVNNFRVKKNKMKRKRNHRVCAILTTALLTAEHELQQKQQQRCVRWCRLQEKLFEQGKWGWSTTTAYNGNANTVRSGNSDPYNAYSVERLETLNATELMELEQKADTESKRREEIDNLWKSELSDLDQFMRSMSSSCNNNNRDFQNNARSSITVSS